MANLLRHPVFSLPEGGRVSLPGLLAAMTRDEVDQFPRVRAHQRSIFHMFLVQLATMAMKTTGGAELPQREEEWAEAIRALTVSYEHDEPWDLIASGEENTAFMQYPVAAKERKDYDLFHSPDNIDIVPVTRNHDVKRNTNWDCDPEDWVYALICAQTASRKVGIGHYGTVRMNGGSSSRVMLGLAPAGRGMTDIDASAWWRRDVLSLLADYDRMTKSLPTSVDGIQLVWLDAWKGKTQLELKELHPFFIDACKRIRLEYSEGRIVALKAGAEKQRIKSEFKGVIGDPWTPVHVQEQKALTLAQGQWDYRRICELLFDGDTWSLPHLARETKAEETEDMVLVAETLSQTTKTYGFKSRVLPLPKGVVRRFMQKEVFDLSKEMVEEAKGVESMLSYALQEAALNGNGGNASKNDRDSASAAAWPIRKELSRQIELIFFDVLWARIAAFNAGDMEAVARIRAEFVHDLVAMARAEFKKGLPKMPCASFWRPRAHARANRKFEGMANKKIRKIEGIETNDAAA